MDCVRNTPTGMDRADMLAHLSEFAIGGEQVIQVLALLGGRLYLRVRPSLEGQLHFQRLHLTLQLSPLLS